MDARFETGIRIKTLSQREERMNMKRSVFSDVLLFSWLCFSPSLTDAAELPGPVVPDGLGINIHFTAPRPGEMEMLTQAGFRWIRMGCDWAPTEHEKGVYDFSAWDRLVATLEKHRVRAIFILCMANQFYDNGSTPVSDEAVAAFARWAAAAVHHFHGHGILWEMYNEPNYEVFWHPQPDVRQYIKLASAVAKAVREVEPDELLIGPAIVGINKPEDRDFLEACFKAGLLESWTAVSVHPYRRTAPETVAPDYVQLQKMIDQYAPQGKKIPILSGEWGYCSIWEVMDETKQGEYLARQFLTNLASGIPLSIWYDWQDDGIDPKEPEHHMGTIAYSYTEKGTPEYRPKPAYWAAKTLTNILDGYRFKERLAIGGETDCVLAFVKGEEKRFVAWSSRLPSPKPVILPVPAGKYSTIDCTGRTLKLLSADASGLSVELSYSPTYVVPEPVAH